MYGALEADERGLVDAGRHAPEIERRETIRRVFAERDLIHKLDDADDHIMPVALEPEAPVESLVGGGVGAVPGTEADASAK
jgi:hypothetical protein